MGGKRGCGGATDWLPIIGATCDAVEAVVTGATPCPIGIAAAEATGPAALANTGVPSAEPDLPFWLTGGTLPSLDFLRKASAFAVLGRCLDFRSFSAAA